MENSDSKEINEIVQAMRSRGFDIGDFSREARKHDWSSQQFREAVYAAWPKDEQFPMSPEAFLDRERVIRSISEDLENKGHDLRNLTATALRLGWSPDQFRKEALDHITGTRHYRVGDIMADGRRMGSTAQWGG